MTEESGPPAVVGPPAAPSPPPVSAEYGAPAPPPPPASRSLRGRRGPVRVIGGVLGVLVVIGIKLFAVAGISRLLHGASPVLIVIVLIVVAILLRRVLRFFLR